MKWHSIDGIPVLKWPNGSGQIKRLHRGAGKPVWRYEVFEGGRLIDSGHHHSLRGAKKFVERSARTDATTAVERGKK